jgi:hypothetical protein
MTRSGDRGYGTADPFLESEDVASHILDALVAPLVAPPSQK